VTSSPVQLHQSNGLPSPPSFLFAVSSPAASNVFLLLAPLGMNSKYYFIFEKSKLFTFSEKRARPINSGDRYHRWFVNFSIAAVATALLIFE
jgi:hypothetical protein